MISHILCSSPPQDVVRRFNAEERRRGGLVDSSIAGADVAGGNDQPLLSSEAHMEAPGMA